jgi:hypothetical protein
MAVGAMVAVAAGVGVAVAAGVGVAVGPVCPKFCRQMP